ncbi:hypothetical protein HH308_01495 [Gordonia sp. TBRC 11910]|uniref:Intracellular septation protein A n=1 Tax=Gordonia asplenii TaxID=2725283 RepID=A0A848KPM5_9ACTN|nr:hypothetical protein [Gordonia asplenii]NMN99886.1 hypothetical protein [Gordonia asplenii]
MTYLRGFIPWIAYGVVAGFADWRWGALSAFVLSVVLILIDRRSGMKVDAQILEISAAVFFAVLTAVAFIAPHSGVEDYDSCLAFGWLALTSWLSLALRMPFTEGIAKREVPQEYWNSPRFKRVNVVITAAWALAFTVTCAVVTVVYLLGLDDSLDIAAQVAGFVVPVMFTNWYRQRAVGAAQDA